MRYLNHESHCLPICLPSVLCFGCSPPDLRYQGDTAMQQINVRIVYWMAATEMGGDAWIFQLKNDRRCEECKLLSYEGVTEWPYYCTRCVEPFWGQMYEYSNCRACKVRSENCTTCQSDLRNLFRGEDARRRRLAHPFLRRISIEWSYSFCWK